MRRIITSMLIIAMMLVTTVIPASFAFADDTTSATEISEESAVLDGQTLMSISEEELDSQSVMGHWAVDEYDDGDSVDENYNSDDGDIVFFATTNGWTRKADGTFYNGEGKGTVTGAIAKGVDVSSHQGSINWAKVKQSDVTFAIIRVGFGSDYPSQDDEKFWNNVKGCETTGIPYGFYLYSYCDNASKNASEIAHTLRVISGTHPTYPVYYDLEDAGTTGKRPASEIHSYALNWCNKIQAAGYIPGIYANKTWWVNKLNNSKLDAYEKWVAQYMNSLTGTTYTGNNVGMWQCASDGSIGGISGRVDLNFVYKKYNGTTAQAPAAPVPTQTATAAPAKLGWITSSGKKYYYYEANKMYKSTYKKIDSYYYGFNSSGAMYKSTTKKIGKKSYTFDSKGRAYICKVKTKAKLNYRANASLNSAKKGTYKKGKSLVVICKNGNWWQLTNGYWINKKYVKVTKKYPSY